MLEINFIPEIAPLATSLGLTVFAITKGLRILIIKRQEGKCGDCGELIGNRLEIHHLLPKALGGSNNPDNLIGLCGEGLGDCHSKWDLEALKHSRLPDGTPLKIPKSLKKK